MLLWSSRPRDRCVGQRNVVRLQLFSGILGCDSCLCVEVLEPCNVWSLVVCCDDVVMGTVGLSYKAGSWDVMLERKAPRVVSAA